MKSKRLTSGVIFCMIRLVVVIATEGIHRLAFSSLSCGVFFWALGSFRGFRKQYGWQRTDSYLVSEPYGGL